MIKIIERSSGFWIVNDDGVVVEDCFSTVEEASEVLGGLRRGIVVQTNYSPCLCAVGSERNFNVFTYLDYGLDWFQWATEGTPKSWVFEDRDGQCPKCGLATTFDEHYIVTHNKPS